MLAAISLVVFVSGAAGLIFEVVWFHRAALVFGNSVLATSLVLSSFMGGLALGSASVAWLGTRLRRPLLIYAALEVSVAVTGFALAALLPILPARFALAFVVLAIPATTMGATLPVVTGASTRTGAAFGPVLGRLYGWNTFGAVAGVVLAEVVLVPAVGVTGTAATAALLNLSAAGIAVLISRRSKAPDAREATSIASQNPAQWPSRALAGTFLSGTALLGLEVIWFRFLSMHVLTTTLAVSVMLSAVLAAIGAGGVAAAVWLSKKPDASAYAAAIAWAGGWSVVGSYAGFQFLTNDVQVDDWRRVLWFSCALTGPCSFFSGVLFTLLGDAVRRAAGSAVRAASWLTMANTGGALCGAPLAAFVLLPMLGMERAFFASALVYAAIGALVIAREPARRTRGTTVALLASGGMLVLALARFPFGLAGSYYARIATPYAADGSQIVATKEGSAETILLMQQRWLGQPVYSRLITNGFSMSGTTIPGQRYMRDFVYWSLLLHAAPLRRILVICYGVGVTAGAAVDVPSAESIDVVELSRDTVSMSNVIYPPAARPLSDPRVRLHIEDGRTFLQATSETFDLITGEPPPPRTPGAVNIYTREYFQRVHDRLAEGGMATYWLPVARPEPGADVNTIVRGFCDVFDDCSLWNATPYDFMLVGTRNAVRQTVEGIARAWEVQALAAQLRDIGFEQPEQMGATFLGDAVFLRELTAATPPLTDDFPRRIVPVPQRPSLSDPRYRSNPAVVDLFQRVLDPVRAGRAFAASAFVARLFPAQMIERTLPWFATQRIVNRALWEGGHPLRQIEDLHAVLTTTTLRTLPLWLLGTDEVKQRIAEASPERSGPTEYARGLRALSVRDYRRGAAHFSEAERRGLDAPTVRALLVYSLCLAGDQESARQLARGITARDADEQHFWSWLTRAFDL